MNPRRAFTLVEIMIAITVLAIVVSIVVPSLQATEAVTLESTSRILAADLRLARHHAIQFNTEYSVQFDLSNNAYELVHTGAGSFPLPEKPLAGPGNSPETYRVELDQLGGPLSRGSGVQLSTVVLLNSAQPVADVTFGPLGGTGPARGEDTIIQLTAGNGAGRLSLEVTVSWITGQVWVSPAEATPE